MQFVPQFRHSPRIVLGCCSAPVWHPIEFSSMHKIHWTWISKHTRRTWIDGVKHQAIGIQMFDDFGNIKLPAYRSPPAQHRMNIQSRSFAANRHAAECLKGSPDAEVTRFENFSLQESNVYNVYYTSNWYRSNGIQRIVSVRMDITDES